MRKRNINFVGKITGSRMKKCQLLSEKGLKKQGRGEFDFRVDIALNVVAVRWSDNKLINIVSSYVSIEPLHTVRRYNRSLKQKVNVKQPNIVYVFNQYMVDIDKLDMMGALYKRRLRTQKWYIYIWFHTIHITVVNAWFLYRGDLKICRPKALLKQFKCYRVELGESLIKVTSSGERPSLDNVLQLPKKAARVQGNPSNDIRKDGFDHMPCYNEKRQRFLSSKSGLSYTSCKKCNTWLCLNKERKCFKVFHSEVF